MKYELFIVADTNDADYVTSRNIVDIETIEKLQPVIDAIIDFNLSDNGHGYNWPNHESIEEQTIEETYPNIDPDLIEEFNEYVDGGECGVHTICDVFMYPLEFKIQLLK